MLDTAADKCRKSGTPGHEPSCWQLKWKPHNHEFIYIYLFSLLITLIVYLQKKMGSKGGGSGGKGGGAKSCGGSGSKGGGSSKGGGESGGKCGGSAKGGGGSSGDTGGRGVGGKGCTCDGKTGATAKVCNGGNKGGSCGDKAGKSGALCHGPHLMKAPGAEGCISRSLFESNPQAYFHDLRHGAGVGGSKDGGAGNSGGTCHGPDQMKAPGAEGCISRSLFESNPQAYFYELRHGGDK